jgi:SPASM domain peptide maturase of grasp-with-spasm system
MRYIAFTEVSQKPSTGKCSMTNNYFRIYACCLLVNGVKRSIICDVQRNSFYHIPNGLYEILTVHKKLSINQIKEHYLHQYDDVIDEYFAFLIEQEFGFYCDESDLELFPDIDLQWDEPAHITNAIIDVNTQSQHDYPSLFDQFELLGCKHFQLRTYSPKPLEYFIEILENLENRRIISVEFILTHSQATSLENLKVLTDKYPRIHNLTVHSSPQNKIAFQDPSGMGNIIFVKQAIDNESHCGIISTDYFSINLKTFTESQKHNTCLNRKIAIDVHGNIKNCPSMAKSYGNIKDTSLKQAIDTEGFKDVWYINKDQIEVCKDCEFRHICTDCRAYIKYPNNIYSKPAKCSYDPYTATWGEDNPTQNPLYNK